LSFLVIKQHDQRDCGAACLAMIASHYGKKLSIAKCREMTKTDKSGTNLYGLTDGAEKIGLSAKALQGDDTELLSGIASGEVTFPLVAHTVSDNAMLHFIVVYGYQKGKFLIGDPARGKLRLTSADFFQIWTGHIVVFRKTPAFQPGNETKGSFVKFFSLLKGQFGRLAGIMVISLAIAAIGIVGAFVFQVVIDDFVLDETAQETVQEEHAEHDHEVPEQEDGLMSKLSGIQFHWIFLCLIALYLLQAVIQFFRGYLLSQLSRKIDIRLSLTYYNHIVDLPVSSIAVRQTGEYLSRFSDTATIRQAISGATLTLLMDSLMVLACGFILFAVSPKLFAVALLMIVFYAVIVLCFRKPVERSNRIVMENNAKLQSYFKESIDGMETVKAACAGEQVKHTTTAKFTDFINSVFKTGLIGMSQDTLADTVELIGTVVILWLGFAMVLTKQVSIGSLITFYALLSYFTEPIKNIISLQPLVQTAVVAAERLNDILDLEKEPEHSNDASFPAPETWELSHVCFRYGNRELTLRDVSMSVRRGEKVAIVGESGSGKTTLAKLLLRFYDPEDGCILCDGTDLREMDLTALRKAIAYVDQNTFLFSDTIRNNLMLGTEATQEEVEHACKSSSADQFISQLPLGYDQPLDEKGANLSGGQKQRLAIARALLRKPQLLILDEATSNLDTITENAIRDTLFGLNDDMACIIIAHRLSTVKNCDRIYVLQQGKIIECGTHQELIDQNGAYAALWNRQ